MFILYIIRCVSDCVFRNAEYRTTEHPNIPNIFSVFFCRYGLFFVNLHSLNYKRYTFTHLNTHMKVISTNYIPLPDPHRLIAVPNGYFYEQIGTLSVLVESESGFYGYESHDHPVVRIAWQDGIDTISGEKTEVITNGEGEVLHDFVLGECFMLCPVDHRVLSFGKFNMLVTVTFSRYECDSSDLDRMLDQIDGSKIKLLAPEEVDQNVELTFSLCTDGKTFMISSSLSNFQFQVRIDEMKDGMVVFESDKVLLEFVNQARVYLRINPRYQFHFSSPLKELSMMVEILNNELNNYLVRDNE